MTYGIGLHIAADAVVLNTTYREKLATHFQLVQPRTIDVYTSWETRKDLTLKLVSDWHAVVVKERDDLSRKVMALEATQTDQALKIEKIKEDQQFNAELRLEYERHLRSNGIQTDELDLIRQEVQNRIRRHKENKGD